MRRKCHAHAALDDGRQVAPTQAQRGQAARELGSEFGAMCGAAAGLGASEDMTGRDECGSGRKVDKAAFSLSA